jgi:hypothetical protein
MLLIIHAARASASAAMPAAHTGGLVGCYRHFVVPRACTRRFIPVGLASAALTISFPARCLLSIPFVPCPSSEGTWWGVDIEHEGICDTLERGVWEPVSSKINSIASATEAACLILSVDETVRNPKSEGADQAVGGSARRPGMGGMGGAKPMSAALGGAGMRGMMGGRGRGVRVMQGRGGK